MTPEELNEENAVLRAEVATLKMHKQMYSCGGSDHAAYTEALNAAHEKDIYDGIRGEQEVMGWMQATGWKQDPKRLTFTTARYKFVAKMLEGSKNVLEVGAGDGWISRIVEQHVGYLTLTDVVGNSNVIQHDFLEGPLHLPFDAGYALDVLEHISPQKEDTFLHNIAQSVHGPVIIGMPSIESQAYASELSKAGHVNCKTKEELRKTMLKHWKYVFMFSMNVETLHTGFMANYWLALAVS
jgi:hypothetical protein